MSKVKKVLYSIFTVFVANLILIKNVVFGNVAIGTYEFSYSPIFLGIVSIGVIGFAGISIFFLKLLSKEAKADDKFNQERN